jgi:ribosomal protein S18 acetylase RimI-like enzyme
MAAMDDLVRRWEIGWGLCRGLTAPAEREAALEVVLGLPGRERELFALKDDATLVNSLAVEVASASKPAWLTVTTHQPDDVAEALKHAGLELFAERKLLMSISLQDHPDATAPPGYRVETTSDGPLEYVEILDSADTVAARGMMAVVGEDAVMHDIHTDPGHRRRGLGRVVMAELGTRARERRAITGLLMATIEGAYLYSRLGWTSEATMLTAKAA